MKHEHNISMRISVALCLLVLGIGCNQSTEPDNNDPIITSIHAFPKTVQPSDSFAVVCSAYDIDGDSLFYDWFCSNGGASIKGAPQENPFELKNSRENMMIFFATDTLLHQTGHAAIFCDVRDDKGGLKTAWIIVGITQ